MNEEQVILPNRKRFAAEDKFKIVKEHLTAKTPVSELCKRYGMSACSFYDWQDQFFSAAMTAFDKKRGPQPSSAMSDAKISQMQGDIDRMREVIAEITSENIGFKKKYSILLK